MAMEKVRAFLDGSEVRYMTITHSLAYTAQEIAALSHISGKEVAKVVIVKVDGSMVMVVLPASRKVDFEHLREALGGCEVELAEEEEFKDVFPDCEVGAMPPFGELYGLEVLVDAALAEDEEIAFNAGTHRHLMQMAYEDLERLVEPRVIDFSQKLSV